MVFEALSRECRTGLPWVLADIADNKLWSSFKCRRMVLRERVECECKENKVMTNREDEEDQW